MRPSERHYPSSLVNVVVERFVFLITVPFWIGGRSASDRRHDALISWPKAEASLRFCS